MSGKYLKAQAYTVSIIEIVISTCALLLMGLGIFVIRIINEDLLEKLSHDDSYSWVIEICKTPGNQQASLLVMPIFYLIGEIGLAAYLIQSISNENLKNCKTWITITSTLIVVGCCSLFSAALYLKSSYWMVYVIYCGSNLFTFYTLWIVNSFVRANEVSHQGYIKAVQNDSYNNNKV